MCLNLTETKNWKTSSENICCYKLLRYENNRLRSPFYMYEYKIGTQEILGETFTKFFEAQSLDNECSLGFHSYVKEEDAFKLKSILEALLKNAANWYSNRYVVARCLIPAGSEYYVGDVYTGYEKEIGENGELPEGYCSNAIIVKEILKNVKF